MDKLFPKPLRLPPASLQSVGYSCLDALCHLFRGENSSQGKVEVPAAVGNRAEDARPMPLTSTSTPAANLPAPEGVPEHEPFHFSIVAAAPVRPRQERPTDFDLGSLFVVSIETG